MMLYRYDFDTEICGWPEPAKNLLTALAQSYNDNVKGLEAYFMDKHNAKFVYTTKEAPTTYVLFPNEYEATMFVLRWA
jgi:hypothetical protein